MCVFRVYSKNTSFKQFLDNNPELPVYQLYEKGERPEIGNENSVYEDYSFSCDVSDREWNDLEGQIIDMISFLEVYSPLLQKLKSTHDIDDWRFDLPYECRLNQINFSQFDYLPPKLIQLSGKLAIGIELSLYWPSQGETLEEEISADSDTDN
ncbi:MAG: hypothetical protein MK207_03430 [Saprospiraceae bacterium]|nr:hypothetical protein [Saprospiraceae bacterium]